jgi:high-affinity K+ transport system ATPase subunit B
MTGTRLNQLNAAIFALVQSLFPALVLLNVVDWTSDEQAIIMLVVTNAITLVGLIFAQSEATNV